MFSDKSRPVLIDRLGPELAGDLVRAVASDMERARLAKERARKAKKKAKKAGSRAR